MAEHCTQLGLPAREDYIFVAKALSQVSEVIVLRSLRLRKVAPDLMTCNPRSDLMFVIFDFRPLILRAISIF